MRAAEDRTLRLESGAWFVETGHDASEQRDEQLHLPPRQISPEQRGLRHHDPNLDQYHSRRNHHLGRIWTVRFSTRERVARSPPRIVSDATSMTEATARSSQGPTAPKQLWW